jgi:hypothetical protein
MAKNLLYQALAFLPVVAGGGGGTGNNDVLTSQSDITVSFRRTVLYQSLAVPVPIVGEVETVTVDKWFNPLAEPPKRKPSIAQQQELAFGRADPFPETVSVDRWLRPLDVPTARRARTPSDLIAFVPIDTAKQNGWQRPLSEPIRIRRQVDYPQPGLVSVVTTAEIITPDKWFTPLSNPTPAKRNPEGSNTFVPVVTGSGDVSFVQTEAVLQYQTTLVYQSIFDPPRVVAAVTVTVDEWFNPLSEPKRSRLSVPDQQSIAFVKAGPFPETVSIDRWVRPLAEPTCRTQIVREGGPVFVPVIPVDVVSFAQSDTSVPYQVTFLYQYIAEPIRVVTETVTLDKWFSPLSDPKRSRPSVPDRQSLAFVKAAPFPEAVSYDRWGYRLSEPVRTRAGLSAALQQAAAFNPYPLPTFAAPALASAVYPDQIAARRFPVSEQQSLAFVKAAPFPEAVSIDRWVQPLATPTRRTRTTWEGGAVFIPVITVEVVSFAQSDTSIPYQVTFLYQYIAEPIRVVDEIVTVDKWYRDLNTPAPALRRSYNAALAQHSFQSNYRVPAPYVDPPMASWSYAWSLPVRVRTSVMTAAQPSETGPVIPQPNPPGPTGQYTVSGLYVTDQFTDNTVVYDYGGGVSHRTN